MYVAAPLADAGRAEALGRRLRSRGASVVSTWHANVAPGEVDPLDVGERRRLLELNLAELAAATVVLVVTDGRGRPRATYGEAAWALAKGMPVVWLAGGGGCLFDAHPGVTLVRTEEGGTLVHLPVTCPEGTSARGAPSIQTPGVQMTKKGKG